MIRALVDTNLPISFLLTSASTSPAIAIMSAAIAGRFRILIAPETLVTGDGDLLSLGAHGGVQIVDPVTFAHRLDLIREPER